MTLALPPASSQTDPTAVGHDEPVRFEQAASVSTGTLTPAVRDKVRRAERSRFVEIDSGDQAALRASNVDLELFPGLTLALDADQSHRPGAHGSTTWSGLADDGDYATLTFIDGQMFGTAAVDSAVYDIAPVSGTTHVIVEDGRTFPEGPETDVLVPPGTDRDPGGAADGPEAGAPAGGGSAPSVEGGAVIDILTWYNVPARNYYGSDAAARANLAAIINETNATFARSGAQVSLRSVAIELVAYTGSGLYGTELSRLAGGTDGYLDDVHDRRDALDADLVALIAPLSDACGVAYLGGAFSVSDPACDAFTHEIGHNLGAGHGGEDGGGLYPYSNGYIDLVNDFRTVMSYGSAACPGGQCSRIGYFSGPTAQYDGMAVGSSTHDNTRTINERAAITAGYRPIIRPPNDNFGAAQQLTGTSGTVTGTNVYATRQADEPLHLPGNWAEQSVWYRWTAPAAGRATIDTCGSDFDTVLAVYTGATISGLTPLAGDDDSCGSNTSRVSFAATAGTTYRIAVDGYGEAEGDLSLTWVLAPPRPPNDNFASSQLLSGRTTSATGTNVGATRQTGEPLHAGQNGTTSVWYRWTAPRTARVEVNTFGSGFNTVLGVYRGATVRSLTGVASNNDSGGTPQSKVRFNATAGLVYRIAVAGLGAATGPVRLQIKPV